MAKLKLIQVGVGGWGWSWANIAKQSEDWDVVAYVDISEENLRKASAYYGMEKRRCYTDLDDAIKEAKADAVLGVVPPSAHADVTIKALEAGLHVLVEKPIAGTLENAKQMIKKAKSNRLKLMVSQQYRFRRAPRTVKKILEEKIVGDPGYVSINFHKAPKFPPGSFRVEMPNPLLMDMSIHHFDMIRGILKIDPISVYAESWNPKWSWFKGNPTAIVKIEMENDVRVVYHGSWVSQGWETTWDGDWRIQCTEGEIHWYNNKIEVKAPIFQTVFAKGLLERNGILEAELVKMPLEDREYSLHEFAQSIIQDRDPETAGEDNLKTFAMTLATIESCNTGKKIKIAEYLR